MDLGHCWKSPLFIDISCLVPFHFIQDFFSDTLPLVISEWVQINAALLLSLYGCPSGPSLTRTCTYKFLQPALVPGWSSLEVLSVFKSIMKDCFVSIVLKANEIISDVFIGGVNMLGWIPFSPLADSLYYAVNIISSCFWPSTRFTPTTFLPFLVQYLSSGSTILRGWSMICDFWFLLSTAMSASQSLSALSQITWALATYGS